MSEIPALNLPPAYQNNSWWYAWEGIKAQRIFKGECPYGAFQKPCHAPFWKKKKTPVNNFFPGEYSKLCALLLCAVNVFFGIYCLSCVSLEGHISIGNIRISHGKWQSRLSQAMCLQMSDQLTLCSWQHAWQCTQCHAHCCQWSAWVLPHKSSQKFREQFSGDLQLDFSLKYKGRLDNGLCRDEKIKTHAWFELAGHN